MPKCLLEKFVIMINFGIEIRYNLNLESISENFLIFTVQSRVK